MLLFLKRSEHQLIELEGNGARYRLWLDGYFQFDSATERTYHELLVDLPLALAEEARSVLILGGGDGLCAREALKYPSVERVVNVELDREVADLALRWPVNGLNRDSFKDPRVELVIDDAKNYLAGEPEAFDLVVCDFPAPTSPELADLFGEGFFRKCAGFLAPGGVLSTQATMAKGDVKRLRETLRGILGQAISVLSRNRREDERFVYASARPFSKRRDLVDAPAAAPALERIASGPVCLAMTR